MLAGLPFCTAGQAHVDDPVEATHRRIRFHVFSNEIRRFLVAVTLLERFRKQQDAAGAGFLGTVVRQHLNKFFVFLLLLVTGAQLVEHFIEEVTVLDPDALQPLDGGIPILLAHFQLAFCNAGSYALIIERQGPAQHATGWIDIALTAQIIRLLTAILGQYRPQRRAAFDQPFTHADGIDPVPLLLVQAHQLLTDFILGLAILIQHFQQYLLGQIEDATGQIILGQLQLNFFLDRAAIVAMFQQVGMELGRPVELAPFAEQLAQGQVGIQALLTHIQALEQRLNPLVGFFIKKEVDASHIILGQGRHAPTLAALAFTLAEKKTGRNGNKEQWQQPKGFTHENRLLRPRRPIPASSPRKRPIASTPITSTPSETSQCHW